jgi:chitinase
MIKKILLSLVLIIGSAALLTTRAEFKIIGYVVDWSGDQSGSLQFDKMTHVNYAFVTVANNTGGISSPNDGLMRNLVTAAHAKGVKVMASIGGGGGNNDVYFRAISANSGYRAAFVTNCDNLLTKYSLDGIDIDWEYPSEAPDPSSANFTLLMTDLATKMHSKGKLVSAAVCGGSVGTAALAIQPAVFQVVDFLNIMAYDHAAAPHSSYEKSVIDLHSWRSRGLPKDKAVLGVPFYGRDANYNSMNYNTIVAADPTAPTKDLYNGYYYNGIPTMQKKTKLAADSGGGIMFWESSMDTKVQSTSLLTAIYNARPIVSTVQNPAVMNPQAQANARLDFAGLLDGHGAIKLSLSKPGSFSVEIVNIQGQRVCALAKNRFFEAGQHDVAIETRLAPGMYRVCLKGVAGGESVSAGRSLVVVE